MNDSSVHPDITETTIDGTTTEAPLPDDKVDMIAAMLRVIGDPTRIRLMEVLNQGGSATGGGLAASLGISQQAVSKQLGVLHQAGIVSRRRAGAWVHYELIDWTGWWLVEQISAALSAGDASR
jgi:DNA-binding transcriptional ArsR family regulator